MNCHRALNEKGRTSNNREDKWGKETEKQQNDTMAQWNNRQLS